MRASFLPSLLLSATLVAASLAACSGDDPPQNLVPDAGTRDAGTDSGVPDAGEPDSGTPDAGEPDAGAPDAGEPDASVTIPTLLSGFNLFTGTPAAGTFQPVAGNIPYTLTTPLFSDYALKSRTLYIPAGKKAVYDAQEVLELPVGTILTKTFAYPKDLREPDKDVRLLETRVLVHQPSGWEAYPYVWTADQTEAEMKPGGRSPSVTVIDETGTERTFVYSIPARNQCLTCHHFQDAVGDQIMRPIGVKARYLNRTNTYGGETVNQLSHLAALGKLEGLPALAEVPHAPDAFDETSGTLDQRARAYLDINCGHCHNPKGTAGITSQLFLNVQNENAFNLGECKRPGSAGSGVGGEFDLVPGDHAVSILWYRMDTEESGKMMPQIGRTLRHQEGSKLISDWIDAMPPKSCK